MSIWYDFRLGWRNTSQGYQTATSHDKPLVTFSSRLTRPSSTRSTKSRPFKTFTSSTWTGRCLRSWTSTGRSRCTTCRGSLDTKVCYWLSITKNLRLLMLDSYSVKSSKSLKPLVFWRENKPADLIRVTNNRSIQTSNYKLIQNTHLPSLRCHSFWNIVVQFSKKCNRTHFVRVIRWRQSHIVFAQESLGVEPDRRQPRRWGGVQYYLLPLCYHDRLNKSRSWTYQRGKC